MGDNKANKALSEENIALQDKLELMTKSSIGLLVMYLQALQDIHDVSPARILASCLYKDISINDDPDSWPDGAREYVEGFINNMNLLGSTEKGVSMSLGDIVKALETIVPKTLH